MPSYSRKEYIKLMHPIPIGWEKDIYDIPYIKRIDFNISNINNGLFLINLNNISKNDANSNVKIIHSFHYDKLLTAKLNNPYKLLNKVSRYYAFCTFDFSMHPGMGRADIIYATFLNRWSGVWMQSNGYENVCVTVGWVLPDTYDICFSGIKDGTNLIISTLGICNEESKKIFLEGYYEMKKRFPNSKIICVGNKLKEINDNTYFVPYENSFGNNDKYNEYWQPMLFAANLKEVDQ